MKRHVEEKELPYFAATLTAYLRESHPELLPDKHFIAERSDHAAQTYERAVRNGNSVYEALELSNAVLYQDLRFSKYDAIFEVVSEWVRRFSYSDANGVASSRSPQKTISGPGRRTG